MSYFSLLDGMKQAYQKWGVGNPRKLLALHGWLDNSNSFSYLGPHLASLGYHVVALDHIGHGRSSHLSANGTYTMIKSVAHVDEVIDQLGWQGSCVLLGHSMGASISVMYAGSFPEKISQLVVIEGFGPMTVPGAGQNKSLRRAIEAAKKASAKGSSVKTYNTLDDAVKARIASVTSYPGKQSLSVEAARSLVSRGTYLASKSGSASPAATPTEEQEEEEVDVTAEDVPVKFRHDPRLVLPTFQYHTPDQVQSYIDGIAVKTLLIVGENGWPIDGHGEFKARTDSIAARGLLTQVILPGSHHLHLDPDSAPATASAISKFLLDTTPASTPSTTNPVDGV